jgi:hypothetical protein
MHEPLDHAMMTLAIEVPPRRRWRRWLFVLTFVMVGTVTCWCLLGYYVASWKYPYGWSHCCDKALYIALARYAQDHGGRYPSGEATPEASLSLLYPKYIDADTLRGKTVPLEVVEYVLKQGKRLGPDTCGWHYVEGITDKDDPELALVWDKAGLGHNGERLSGGGHDVVFRYGVRYVSGADWPEFMKKQEELLAKRKQQPSVGSIKGK